MLTRTEVHWSDLDNVLEISSSSAPSSVRLSGLIVQIGLADFDHVLSHGLI